MLPTGPKIEGEISPRMSPAAKSRYTFQALGDPDMAVGLLPDAFSQMRKDPDLEPVLPGWSKKDWDSVHPAPSSVFDIGRGYSPLIPTEREQMQYADAAERMYLRGKGRYGLGMIDLYDAFDMDMIDPETQQLLEDSSLTINALYEQRAEAIRQADEWARAQIRSDAAQAELGEHLIGTITSFLGLGRPDSEDLREFTEADRAELRKGKYEELMAEWNKVAPPVVDTKKPSWYGDAMVATGPAGIGRYVPTLSVRGAGGLGKTAINLVAGAMGILDQIQVVPDINARSFLPENLGALAESRNRRKVSDQADRILDTRLKGQLATTANLAWEDADPAAKQFALELTGGDEIKAMGLFTGMLGSEDEETSMVQMMAKRVDEEHEALIMDLSERDFEISGSVMDVLDTWGRFTGHIGTGLGLFMSDEDWREAVTSGEFRTAMQQIFEYDARPSGVWGLEGTALGLAVDFGLSMAVDPTTWLFAPAKGASAFRQFATESAARGWVRGAGGRAMVRDFERVFVNPVNVETALLGQVGVTWGMPLQWRAPLLEHAASGTLTKEIIAETIEDAVVRGGWVPGKYVDRLAWASYMRNTWDSAFAEATGLDGLAKVYRTAMQQHNTTSTIHLYGSTWVDDTIETMAKLYGEDIDGLRGWMGDFVGRVKSMETGFNSEYQMVASEVNGLLNERDLLSSLANGNVRPLEEGFSLGGMQFEDLDDAIAQHQKMLDDLGGVDVQPVPAELGEDAVSAAGDVGTQVAEVRSRLQLLEQAKAQMSGPGSSDLRTVGLWMSKNPNENAFMQELYGTPQVEAGTASHAPMKGVPNGIQEPVVTPRSATLPLVKDESLVGYGSLEFDAKGNLSGIVITADNVGDAQKLLKGLMEQEPGLTVPALLRRLRDIRFRGPMDPEELNKMFRQFAVDYYRSTGLGGLARQVRAEVQARYLKAAAQLQKMSVKGGPREAVRQSIIRGYEQAILRDPVLSKMPGLVVEGKVDWSVLRTHTSRFGIIESPQKVPGAQERVAVAGMDEVEKDMRTSLYAMNHPLTVELPASPLDVALLKSAVGRAGRKMKETLDEVGTRVLAVKVGTVLKELEQALHVAFVYDKVLRPATAINMHLDEIYRINHQYGPEAARMWLEDKTASLVSAIDDTLQKLTGDFAGGLRLPPKVRERAIERLQKMKESIPMEKRAAEDTLRTRMSEGTFDITPEHPAYMDAARQWSNFFLQDEGFLAWRTGKFNKYWESEDALWLKQQSKFDKGGTMTLVTKEDVIGMYENIWEHGILGHSFDPQYLADEFDKAAHRILAGERQVELPADALEAIGVIPASVADPGKRGIKGMFHRVGQKITDAFDDMVLGPTEYRQSLIARLERSKELSRLKSLYESQGYQVISKSQADQLVGRQGIGTTVWTDPAAGHFMDEQLLRQGYVTQNYIEALADKAAVHSMDDVMYKWWSSSIAGRGSRVVAPFGKPYADMWGYWFRKAFARPVLRGWVNTESAGRLSKMLDGFMQHYPVGILPNKTTAMVSRLANLDMNLDNQEINIKFPWIALAISRRTLPFAFAGRGIFGDEMNIQGLDMGPMSFLPTRGDNVFMSVLPGLGPLPITGLDYAMPSKLTDRDKLNEFQKWMADTIPEVFPPVGFGQQGPWARLAGGGWASYFARTFSNTWFKATGSYPFGASEFTADVTAASEANAYARGAMSDPEFLSTFIADSELMDSEDITEQLIMGLVNEAISKGSQNAQSKITIRQVLPTQINPAIGVDESPEIWAKAAVRFQNHSFGLVDQRDLRRYMDDPSRANEFVLANSFRQGFHALSDTERYELILDYPALAFQQVGGYVWNESKKSELPSPLGEQPYSFPEGQDAFEIFSEWKRRGWVLPKATKTLVMEALGYYFDLKNQATSDVWANAVTWIQENDPAAGNLNDGDPLNTDFPRNGEPPKYLQSYTFNVPVTTVAPWAAKLGIDLGDEYTGAELVEALQEKIAENQSPLSSLTVPLYRASIETYGSQARNALEVIKSLAPGKESYPDLWVSFYSDTRELMRDLPKDDPEVQDRIKALREGYATMASAFPDEIAWKTTWDKYFAPNFGPWPKDWEPPTPPEDHKKNGIRPYIWDVVDGDTIVVSEDSGALRVGGAFFPSPGLELSGPGTVPTKKYEVRLVGMRAPEVVSDPEAAAQFTKELFDALNQAPPGSIWLVQDERFPKVDQYGRRLMWLYIDGEYFYDPDSFRPTDPVAYDLAKG